MIDKLQKYTADVKSEWKKVEWPNRKELVNSTIIVFVVIIIFTTYIFFVDGIINKLFMLFLNV